MSERRKCPTCGVKRAYPGQFRKVRDGVTVETRSCRTCLDQQDREAHANWRKNARVVR